MSTNFETLIDEHRIEELMSSNIIQNSIYVITLEEINCIFGTREILHQQYNDSKFSQLDYGPYTQPRMRNRYD